MNLSLQEIPTLQGDEVTTPIPQSAVITILVMTVTFSVAGTFGNTVVCVLVIRRRDFRKVPHFLFASLSANGLISSVFVMPFIISIAAKTYMMRKSESMDILCKIRLSSSFFCSVINALTLTLMAIDRQDCVYRPLRRRINNQNIEKCLLVVWCVVIIITVLFAIVLETDGSQCPPSDPFNLQSSSSNSSSLFNAYILVLGTGFNVAAILTIVITFLRTVKRLRSCPLPQSRSLHLRNETQITKLTYKTCAIFLLSWFPVIISSMIVRFTHGVDLETGRIVKLITVIFSNFTYVANPILHYKMLKIAPTNQPTQVMAMRRIGSIDLNGNL